MRRIFVVFSLAASTVMVAAQLPPGTAAKKQAKCKSRFAVGSRGCRFFDNSALNQGSTRAQGGALQERGGLL